MTSVEFNSSADEERCKHELAVELFNHIETQLALGESRASVLLAANALLAAAYATVVKDQGLIAAAHGVWASILGVAAIALALSLVLSLWAIFPATHATWFKKPDSEDLFFFAYIATLESSEYTSRYKKAKKDEIDESILKSIHGKSIKAREKFTVLFCAAISTVLSLAFFAIVLTQALVSSS